jgi:hypothetical protein
VNLNGFVNDASFQLHHKKPGISSIQRELEKVGDGGKTAHVKKESSPFPHIVGVT